jgi:hypothetical protein
MTCHSGTQQKQKAIPTIRSIPGRQVDLEAHVTTEARGIPENDYGVNLPGCCKETSLKNYGKCLLDTKRVVYPGMVLVADQGKVIHRDPSLQILEGLNIGVDFKLWQGVGFSSHLHRLE